MCITGADIRSEEESMVWNSLCPECSDKAERLLDESKDPASSTSPWRSTISVPNAWSG